MIAGTGGGAGVGGLGVDAMCHALKRKITSGAHLSDIVSDVTELCDQIGHITGACVPNGVYHKINALRAPFESMTKAVPDVTILRSMEEGIPVDFVALRESLRPDPKGLCTMTGTAFLINKALPRAIRNNSLPEVMYILCRVSWIFSTAQTVRYSEFGDSVTMGLREADMCGNCNQQFTRFANTLCATSTQLSFEFLNELGNINGMPAAALGKLLVVQAAFELSDKSGPHTTSQIVQLSHDMLNVYGLLMHAISTRMMNNMIYVRGDTSWIPIQHLQRPLVWSASIWASVHLLSPRVECALTAMFRKMLCWYLSELSVACSKLSAAIWVNEFVTDQLKNAHMSWGLVTRTLCTLTSRRVHTPDTLGQYFHPAAIAHVVRPGLYNAPIHMNWRDLLMVADQDRLATFFRNGGCTGRIALENIVQQPLRGPIVLDSLKKLICDLLSDAGFTPIVIEQLSAEVQFELFQSLMNLAERTRPDLFCTMNMFNHVYHVDVNADGGLESWLHWMGFEQHQLSRVIPVICDIATRDARDGGRVVHGSILDYLNANPVAAVRAITRIPFDGFPEFEMVGRSSHNFQHWRDKSMLRTLKKALESLRSALPDDAKGPGVVRLQIALAFYATVTPHRRKACRIFDVKNTLMGGESAEIPWCLANQTTLNAAYKWAMEHPLEEAARVAAFIALAK